jgi:hypothetical protein
MEEPATFFYLRARRQRCASCGSVSGRRSKYEIGAPSSAGRGALRRKMELLACADRDSFVAALLTMTEECFIPNQSISQFVKPDKCRSLSQFAAIGKLSAGKMDLYVCWMDDVAELDEWDDRFITFWSASVGELDASQLRCLSAEPERASPLEPEPTK